MQTKTRALYLDRYAALKIHCHPHCQDAADRQVRFEQFLTLFICKQGRDANRDAACFGCVRVGGQWRQFSHRLHFEERTRARRREECGGDQEKCASGHGVNLAYVTIWITSRLTS